MEGIEGVPEISPLSLKTLGDKSFDKRKAAVQEINGAVTKIIVFSIVVAIISRVKEISKKLKKY